MDKISEVVEMLYQRLRGSCEDTTQVIDQLIEEGDLDQNFFRENETAILHGLDNQMFCCDCCGWNCESSEMSSIQDWTCLDCCNGEEDET
jgi:hypothetical protein